MEGSLASRARADRLEGFSLKFLRSSMQLLGKATSKDFQNAASFFKKIVFLSRRIDSWWLSLDSNVKIQAKALLMQALSSSCDESKSLALDTLLKIAWVDLPSTLHAPMKSSLREIYSINVCLRQPTSLETSGACHKHAGKKRRSSGQVVHHAKLSVQSSCVDSMKSLMKTMRQIIRGFQHTKEKMAAFEWIISISYVFYNLIRDSLVKDMAEGDFDNSHVNPLKKDDLVELVWLLLNMVFQNDNYQVRCTVKLDMAAVCCLDVIALGAGNDIVPPVKTFFNARITSSDWRQKRAAIRALGSIMAGPTCMKLTRSTSLASVLQKILYALQLTPNILLRDTVVLFLRRFFEFQHHATVETLLALEKSTCEQIFDVLLRSMDSFPDVAENACYAVFFLAKCCPHILNVLAEVSERCVWSLHRAAHRDVDHSGLRRAAFGALHEVVRFVAAPVIGKLISHIACELSKALHKMDTAYRGEYIQYECRSLKIILHKLGKSEVAESSLKKQLDVIAKLLLGVFDHVKDVEFWKDAVSAIGALAHAIGPDFEKYMAAFFTSWKSSLMYSLQSNQSGAGELYDAMVVVMIRLSRALKGKILPYCGDILSQLEKDLFSPDLHVISILCCYAELALALGADFHSYLKRTMDTLGRLTSSKHDVLLKPEGRHLICAMLETYYAIIQCFKEPSESHHLNSFASNIGDFLCLICGLDMDARVTTAVIPFIRCLAAVPGEMFSYLIYDENVQSFWNQCSISKDPLIEACANYANRRLRDASYNLRRRRRESEVREHLTPVAIDLVQDHEYSELELLSIFYVLPQGVDSCEKNSITYDSLSSILSEDGEQVSQRILAGKILLAALGSEKKWDNLTYFSQSWISKCLVRTLFCCEGEARSIARDILKCIGGMSRRFDLIWFQLKKFLCSDVGCQQPHLNTLEMLADVLKNLGPSSDRPDESLINKLHNAIHIEASERSDSVDSNWLQILHYSYCSPRYLSDNVRNFIFNATEFLNVKVAALECLTALFSRYEFNERDQSRVRDIMLKAMKVTDKHVSYQAFVFWIAVCQKAISVVKEINFVMDSSKSLLAALLEILFIRGIQHHRPTDPDLETRNLTEAAFECLHFVAQTIGNKIIDLVENDVWQKEAGIQAFGSILVGPTGQALSSIITSAFSKVQYALEGSPDNSVNDAVTWTLSQIFKLHHPIVKTLTKHQLVIDFLQLRITDTPVVAKNACHAFSSLIQGVDAYMWDKLSPHFDVIVTSLYVVGHGQSVSSLELKVAAYEALHEFMTCANEENFSTMLSLTTDIMNDLSHALKPEEYEIEELKNQCRSLLVITQKLGTSEKYRNSFMENVHQIITLLTRVLQCESVIVCKEAMLAVGAIAYVNGGAFEEHMGELETCWEVGVQNFEQHSEVYLVMLSVIVDVCRVLKEKMLQFCDKIIIPPCIDLSSGERKLNWAPSIACICEIAREVGDEKFLKHAMDILQEKTWFGLDRACHLDVDNILFLRPGLVQAYRAIFQGLDSNPIPGRFADDTLDVLLKFSNLLYKTDDMDHAITRRVIEVLEHLTNRKGPSMADFNSVSRPLTYSKVDQGLIVHLKKSGSSLKKSTNLVEGSLLMEVYAVHVKTEQPCHLYGTIKVNAGIVSRCLYNRKRDDAEHVSSEETALFFNVLERIPGGEAVTLEVDLKHKAGDGGPSTDDEVCRNEITMIYGGDDHKGYNRPLEATTEGKKGSVRISFIEFNCATTAYVRVSLLEPPQGIHGQITTYNTRYPRIKRELFCRYGTDGIDLSEETFLKVKLYEGVVVVPLNSILIIKADLWRSLTRQQSSIPYIKLSAQFNVRADGSTSKVSRLRDSTIMIEVFFGF